MTQEQVKYFSYTKFFTSPYYLSQWVMETASGIAEDHRAYFGFLTFFAFSILIVLTLLEIIARLFKHELQGAKLKIREGEGVSLEMDSRERE